MVFSFKHSNDTSSELWPFLDASVPLHLPWKKYWVNQGRCFLIRTFMLFINDREMYSSHLWLSPLCSIHTTLFLPHLKHTVIFHIYISILEYHLLPKILLSWPIRLCITWILNTSPTSSHSILPLIHYMQSTLVLFKIPSFGPIKLIHSLWLLHWLFPLLGLLLYYYWKFYLYLFVYC